MMLPRDVECPLCKAPVNVGCHSRKQPAYLSATHKARWAAIGVKDPTPEQLHQCYADGRERDDKQRTHAVSAYSKMVETARQRMLRRKERRKEK